MGPSASRAKAVGSQIQPHCLSQGWGGAHTGGSFQLSARLPQAPGSRAFLHSDYDVALSCIRKLVAGKSDNPEPPCDELGRSQPALTATPSTPAAASSCTKPKVLTAASTLKFIPEELAVFCRDFRLLRFHFQENGLALQAFRVSWRGWQLRGTQGGFVPSSGVLHGFGGGTCSGGVIPGPGSFLQIANAIAQAREAAAWLGDAGEGHDGWCCPAEAPLEDEDEEEGSAATLLFESLRDWEKELKRLGAVGWRVSAVNERFDMAPRYGPNGHWGPWAPQHPILGGRGGEHSMNHPHPEGTREGGEGMGKKSLPSVWENTL